MKTSLASLLILAFIITGCSTKISDNNVDAEHSELVKPSTTPVPPVSTTPSPTTSPAEISIPTYSVKEDAPADFFTYNVKSVSTATEIDGYTTENEFLIVEFSTTNTDKVKHFIERAAFTLVDGAGREYNAATITSYDYLMGNVAPGLTKTFKMAFEIPKENSGLSIIAYSGHELENGDLDLKAGYKVKIDLGK